MDALVAKGHDTSRDFSFTYPDGCATDGADAQSHARAAQLAAATQCARARARRRRRESHTESGWDRGGEKSDDECQKNATFI